MAMYVASQKNIDIPQTIQNCSFDFRENLDVFHCRYFSSLCGCVMAAIFVISDSHFAFPINKYIYRRNLHCS